MVTAEELRKENERIQKELQALFSRNTTLQRELMNLNTERDLLVAKGNDIVTTLTEELKEVDNEFKAIKSQRDEIVHTINRQKSDKELEIQAAQEAALVAATTRSRRMSSAISKTIDRARSMSSARQRRPSTLSTLKKTVSESMVSTSSTKTSPMLSYSVGSKKTLIDNNHTHYNNFRSRRSGLSRRNRETVLFT